MSPIILNPSTIVKPCQEKVIIDNKQTCVYDGELLSHFETDYFEPSYWLNNNKVVGQATGRGITYFVDAPKNQWVLRHYYRGGLIGKLIDDSYFFTGLKHTRAAKEFALLKALEQLKLPAPKAIGYRIQRGLLSYRADILTQRIEQAEDLVGILAKRPVNEDVWQAIGACIRQFHQHGVYHHDLNIHNILIDSDNKIWLIDFDQGDIRRPAQQWQQSNIDRLHRSFKKELGKNPQLHWQEQDWQFLLEGYLS